MGKALAATRTALAAGAVLVALLGTSPASAESWCIHKDNCYGLPGPNIVGGGMTDHFTVKLRLLNAEVVKATGVKFESTVPVFEGLNPGDLRVLVCIHGGCSGENGYTLGWHPTEGNYLRAYANGACTQFLESNGYLPGACILPPA